MGNIRTSEIKKATFNLVELYPDRFTTDFEKNKLALNEFKIVEIKSVRNELAGYITRRMKILESAKAAPQTTSL